MADEKERQRLITLVQRIIDGEGTEAEHTALMLELKRSVSHPEPTDLIYHPPDGKELTAEEVVDIALSYKTFLLGPSSQT